MSLAWVSSPGVPTILPKNLRGVGTVLEAGRWSTSSVVMRGSWRYSLIFFVYSSSLACCAPAGDGGATTPWAAARAQPSRRAEATLRDIMPPCDRAATRETMGEPAGKPADPAIG